MNPNRGKVYLVGAGPGDAGLITVKAAELIKKADVVLYDYLVNPELLDYCQSACELVYVGNKKDKYTFPQQEMLRATLKTLNNKMDEAGFKPPALMVVGEVVNFADQLKPIVQSAECVV